MTATTPLDAARDEPRLQRAAVEIPTLVLILAVYSSWFALTYQYGNWPLWVVAPLTALLLTLHSSLQHEIVHGHPTRSRSINRLFGLVPLSLWLPFERYRHNHLVHHINSRLTDPLDDPESYYWMPEHWKRTSAIRRVLFQVQQTLAGRIMLGSFSHIAHFIRLDIRAFLRNEGSVRIIWLEHLLWCVPIVLWLKLVCGMPMWIYALTMVVPALSVLLIRSFAEHRARPGVLERTAIVEGSWILGPLFLFNNLHAMHHEDPAMPWYQYNARYRRSRERLIAANGGLVYSTYFDVARRYLFRPHDALEHPMGRIPRGVTAD